MREVHKKVITPKRKKKKSESGCVFPQASLAGIYFQTCVGLGEVTYNLSVPYYIYSS